MRLEEWCVKANRIGTAVNTGSPARGAYCAPRPNRPQPGGLRSEDEVLDRKKKSEAMKWAGSEALNVNCN